MMKNQTEAINWSRLPSFKDYRRLRLMQLPPKQTEAEQKSEASEEVKKAESEPKPETHQPEH